MKIWRLTVILETVVFLIGVIFYGLEKLMVQELLIRMGTGLLQLEFGFSYF
ncbi:hypothetical protein UCCLB95_0854 [Levilactobacillus brevis]|nr:hypothetical protein UCCLB95_0854 [Levilactobacillus brevis]